MKNEELINAVAVIAEPVRIQILRLIASRGELRAKDILPKFDITQPTLSHHMAILEEHALVSARKDGRCVYYSINKKTFTAINSFFHDFIAPSGGEIDVSVKPKKPVAKKTEDKKDTVKKVPAKKTPAKKADPVKEPEKKKKDKGKDKDKKKKDKKKKK